MLGELREYSHTFMSGKKQSLVPSLVTFSPSSYVYTDCVQSSSSSLGWLERSIAGERRQLHALILVTSLASCVWDKKHNIRNFLSLSVLSPR